MWTDTPQPQYRCEGVRYASDLTRLCSSIRSRRRGRPPKRSEVLRLVKINEPKQCAPRIAASPVRGASATMTAVTARLQLAGAERRRVDDGTRPGGPAQILVLIFELRSKLGTAVILITWNLGIVAKTAQCVTVMYAGRKVDEGAVAMRWGSRSRGSRSLQARARTRRSLLSRERCVAPEQACEAWETQ
jgi:hypothetical protein